MKCKEKMIREMEKFMRYEIAESKSKFDVLIVNYEKYLKEKIAKILTGSKIGLLICDEAHKLKNRTNKLYKAINNTMTKRRILLTGTPIQNNLNEYCNLIHFVQPNWMNGDLKVSSKIDFVLFHFYELIYLYFYSDSKKDT